MNNTNMQIIFTSDPEADRIALAEVRKADKQLKFIDWLEPGVGRAELSMGWRQFSSNIRRQHPIFCRHVNPVQAQTALDGTMADLDHLAASVKSLVPHMIAEKTFSVQTRLVGKGSWAYRNFDVNQRLSEIIEKSGAVLDVRNPDQVISVVCTPTHGYLGISFASENLSNWAGGARRFKREHEQVSRAEFKLLEALEIFKVTLPEGGTALDLGAAPGGWTRILRQHGMKVIAIDPADLNPEIEADPDVRHIRKLAQDYFPTTDRFDIIVNDMRMDARDSARVMLSAINTLKPDGVVIMTLKLPEGKMLRTIESTLEILGAKYKIANARQLFHNRSEITVFLKKLPDEKAP